VSVDALFRRYYGDTDGNHRSIDRLLMNNPALADAWGPTTLKHRYVSEDIAYGLAPLEHLAHQLGVATPISTSLIRHPQSGRQGPPRRNHHAFR